MKIIKWWGQEFPVPLFCQKINLQNKFWKMRSCSSFPVLQSRKEFRVSEFRVSQPVYYAIYIKEHVPSRWSMWGEIV